MSWMKEIAKKVAATEQIDFIVTSALDDPSYPEVGVKLIADACYLSIFVDAIRIPRSRLGTAKLHGVVHGFTKLQREETGEVEIAFVTAHDKLAPIDSRHLDKVLMVSQRMAGPVPYRGGDVDLEVALFSVKNADLVLPFLELMTDLSKQAGVGFVEQTTPFVPVIRRGVERLLSMQSTSTLEIGISTTLADPITGTFALIAANKETFSQERLSIDRTDRKLLRSGKPLTDVPYLILRIEAKNRRDDFSAIPDIRAAYEKCREHVRANRRKDALDALNALRLTAITSPDLLSSDARRLVAKMEELYKEAFSSVLMNKPTKNASMPDLESINLYDA